MVDAGGGLHRHLHAPDRHHGGERRAAVAPESLNATFSELQWVVDAYALTLATCVLTAGSAADLYGRKRVFIAGIVLFTLRPRFAARRPPRLPDPVSGAPGNRRRDHVRGLARPHLAGVPGQGARDGLRDLGCDDRRCGRDRPARRRDAHLVAFAGAGSSSSTSRSGSSPSCCRSGCSTSRTIRNTGASTRWASCCSQAALFSLVFALIEGNKRGWSSALIVSLLVAVGGPARRLHRAAVAPAGADDRPATLPQAGVHRRSDCGVHDVGLALRDVPLPHALHAGGARLLAAPGRDPVPTMSLLAFVAAPIGGKLSAKVPVRLLMGGGLALCALAGADGGSDGRRPAGRRSSRAS